MNIAILGAGAFGQALGKILTDNGHQVNYYDPLLYPEVNIDAATYQASAIIVTIPSSFLDSFLADYPDRLKKIPTIIATKGLVNTEKFADFDQLSVISGPNYAKEILDGKPAIITASNPFAMGLFHNEQIEVELCDDETGILLCGSLKNIYAIGSGYYDHCKNMSATYIQRAYTEMRQYLEDHGCNPKTTELACGLGDLILTCTNESSRDYACGKMISEGKSIEEIKEQIKTIEGLAALECVETEKYQLLRNIRNLVNQTV